MSSELEPTIQGTTLLGFRVVCPDCGFYKDAEDGPLGACVTAHTVRTSINSEVQSCGGSEKPITRQMLQDSRQNTQEAIRLATAAQDLALEAFKTARAHLRGVTADLDAFKARELAIDKVETRLAMKGDRG